ncbi:MAG TPA: protein kinase [Tepidisphaeraceae bacterium]|jgi:predicted Ser/Thr protein kinase|nr:protein kinase [Tepidisphaeraceae bacterium]
MSSEDSTASYDGFASAPEPADALQLPRIPGYQLLREIGAGGMGVVYTARQLGLNRVVAIKMLRGHFDRRDLQRFVQEAETAAAIHHTNIVHIYEVGSIEGKPFFSMEYLEGGTLAAKLASPMKPREAAELIQTLAKALQVAHSRGVVHRDLKPANVLFSSDGCPKLTDFGIAKRMADHGKLTQSGVVMGTPNYMAPEQAEGASNQAGPAADVYSLGSILYELLAGRPPFVAADSDTPLAVRVLQEDPVSPAFHQPSIPRELEAICLMCLHKKPSARYASADALVEDLRRFLADEPIVARPPTKIMRTAKWVRRHPVRAIVRFAAVTALVLAAWRVWYWDAYQRVRTEYYTDFQTAWGELEGGTRLHQEQVLHRQASLKILRKGRLGRVFRGDFVNGHGYPTPPAAFITWIDGFQGASGDDQPHRQTCRVDCIFTASGLVAEEVGRDRNDHITYRFQYDYQESNGAVDRKVVKGRFFDRNGFELTSRSGASYVQIWRDDHGVDQRGMFFDAWGQPAANSDGVYGLSLARDSQGRATDIIFLNQNAQPMPNHIGVARIIASNFDAFGNSQLVQFADGGGKSITNNIGIAMMESEYDVYGNLIRATSLDASGRKIPHIESGFATVRQEFDDYGCLKKVAYFDANDLLLDFGEMEYDARGFPTLVINRTAKGDFKSGGKTRYDDRGNKIESIVLDKHGKEIGRETQKLDLLGNVAEEILQTATGIRHKTLRVFNGDRLLEERYLDRDDKPFFQNGRGSRQTFVYDNNRVLKEKTKWGFSPTEHGYAAVRLTFDARGKVIEEMYLGTNAEPVAVHGYTIRATDYDIRGRRILEKYLDADRKPVRTTVGYDRIRFEYTPAEDVTRVWELGYDGSEGYATACRAHDARGKIIEETFLDAEGKNVSVEVVVSEVKKGGQGEAKELLVGDVFVEYDGRAVKSVADFISHRDREPNPGPAKELKVRRQGQTVNRSIRPGKLSVELRNRVPGFQPRALRSPAEQGAGEVAAPH